MKNAIKVICFVLVVIIAGIGSGYVYFTWDVGEFETIEGSKSGTVIITDYIGESKNIIIPKRLRGKKVISIDDNAFKGDDITSVKIGDNVTSIGINVFQNCKKLTSVDMGKSLVSVGEGAFSNCTELTQVKCSPVLEKLSSAIFGNDAKLATLDLEGNKNFKMVDGVLYSADMTKLYETLLSADLTSYVCPESVVELNEFAFYAQDELREININDGVKIIPRGAFIDCKNLTEIELPDSVITIGTVILSGSGIKTIKIPASVTKIDDYAFYNVEEQVTIVTTKGSAAAKYAERKGIALSIVESL